jgi:PAS domain S-box-containing protein
MTGNNEERPFRSEVSQDSPESLKTHNMSDDEFIKQSELMRVTIASIGDGVISTDVHSRITFMNGVAETITGWSFDDASGRPLAEVFRVINEWTRQPAENPIERALQDGQITKLANHTLLIARDGTERPIDHSATPMFGESKQPIGVVLVFRDVTERARAQEALARLAAIVESSQDAIISKTLDGIIRTWNAGAERLFGYTPEEAIGQPITLIIPLDRRNEEQLIIQRLVKGERIEHFETVRSTKSGKMIDISLTVSPLRDSEGHVIGASKIARDITTQKLALELQQQLQGEVEDERSRLSNAFHHAPSFMAVLRGPDHVFELANDKYIDLIGGRQIIGKTVREALPEIAGQGLFELLDQVYQTGEPFVGSDMRVMLQTQRNRPPQEVFLEFVYQPLRHLGGAVSGILVQGIDLTERNRAQQDLIRVTAESDHRRRLYETILSSTPDFIYIFSLDHKVIYANEALLTMWGMSWDEAYRKSFLELGYEPWHAEMHCREIDTVRATGQPLRGEVPFNGTNGRRIYDYIFVPVIGSDGSVEAVAGTTRDVTERHQMEEILRQTDRNKDEFIALLAHELRNPLAPLLNGLQAIRLSGGDPNVLNDVRDIMERQLKHMVRLIDDLLDVSRLSRNKMELRRSRVLLSEVIRNAVETVQSVIQESDHEFIVTLPDEPIYLNADLTRLAQVFSNLLTNSAKYTKPHGHIWLTAEPHGAEIKILVKDDGIGIPYEALATVFDMFCQVDRSIERSSGGLGIGLALVKGLVEKHDGTVSVTSEGQDYGSTFTVTLPIMADVEHESDPGQSGSDTAGIPPRQRILVVDDNVDSAETMAIMLKFIGNDVRTAHDGLAGVEAALEFHPHIILMDVGMPRMNGHDATRKIREQNSFPQPIIIALTGWGQDADRAQTKAAGCNGHLVKPMNLPELEMLLQELGVTASGQSL